MSNFKILTDAEHMLARPGMYIGSTTLEPQTGVFDYEYKELNVVPGLLKIINEIIDNSVDEFIRTDGKYANKIDVTIDLNPLEPVSISVQDNGRGLPMAIVLHTWMYCFQNEIALAKYSNVKPKVLERLETVCMEVLRSELAYCDVLFSDQTNITRQGKTDITIDLLKEAVRFEAQTVFDFFGFELPFARIERHPLPYTLQWKEINATQTSP